MRAAAILFALLLFPTAAFAEKVQFEKGQAVRLEPNKAYLLVHTNTLWHAPLGGNLFVTPLLFRVLTEEELQKIKAAFEKDPDRWQKNLDPNVVVIEGNRPYEEINDKEHVMLVPVRPGTYILGVIGHMSSMMDTPVVGICPCMGTVKFEASPGVITDMGAIWVVPDGEPTDIPELAKVVTGKDTELSDHGWDIAIRPADPASHVPPTLRDLPRAPADYRATPSIPNYTGATLSRLAPLPGVLDYDKDGEVIDLKAKP
jgi:hypothetical protein